MHVSLQSLNLSHTHTHTRIQTHTHTHTRSFCCFFFCWKTNPHVSATSKREACERVIVWHVMRGRGLVSPPGRVGRLDASDAARQLSGPTRRSPVKRNNAQANARLRIPSVVRLPGRRPDRTGPEQESPPLKTLSLSLSLFLSLSIQRLRTGKEQVKLLPSIVR